MSYVTRDLVAARIPAPVLTDALDDNGDGIEDAGLFDNIVAAASQEVDGYLAGLYNVPFADVAPAKVRAAAFAFTCEAIFQRRNVPFPKWLEEQVLFWRPHMAKVGNRELPFDAGVAKAFTPGAADTECNSINAQGT
jgi:hypothetical protein